MAGLAAEDSATLIEAVRKMHTPSIGRAAQTNSARRKAASSASGASDFARHVGTMSTPATEHALELAAPASLTGILGAQEIDADEGDPRGAAQGYGTDLLDRLALLRIEVLDGRVSASRLAALGNAVRADGQRCGDSRLDAIIEAIELRVEVEIAKLEIPRQALLPTRQGAAPHSFSE